MRTNVEKCVSGPFLLWKTWKDGDKQYVRYLMVDKDGCTDYTTNPHKAHQWKTRQGAQRWLDRRGGFGSYTVTGLHE